MDILYEIEKTKEKIGQREFSDSQADRCIIGASRRYNIHPLVIKSLLIHESGKIGTLSKNTDGSYDLGPMQINTINVPFLQKEFQNLTWKDLASDLCLNIYSGSYFLKTKLDEADNFWKGVGNYHSKTPFLRERYLGKVIPIYKKLLANHQKKAQILALRRRSRNIHIQ